MRAALLSVFVLLAVGAGSAALVEVYGSITGTATVESALEIESLQTDNNQNVTQVTLKNNASQAINLTEELVSLETPEDNSGTLSGTIASNSTKEITGLELGFSDARNDEIAVIMDGNTVFSDTIGDLDAG